MAIATINPATGEIVNTFQAEALFDPDRDSNYAPAEKPAVATPSDAPATIAPEIVENASVWDPSGLITLISDPTVP